MANKDNLKKISELLSLCMEIQSRRSGEEGPYIYVTMSNYGTDLSIGIQYKGFSVESGYDEYYIFEFDRVSESYYEDCKRHLEDLAKKVSACTDISAPGAETI